MADTKPPPPTPILEGTVFIKNPLGAIHDLDSNEPREQVVLELAKTSSNGWRMASDEEIAAYCKANNLEPPEAAKRGPGRPPKAESE